MSQHYNSRMPAHKQVYIKKNYKKYTIQEMADTVDETYLSVWRLLEKLNLHPKSTHKPKIRNYSIDDIVKFAKGLSLDERIEIVKQIKNDISGEINIVTTAIENFKSI